MTSFIHILADETDADGNVRNPYAGRTSDGDWIDGCVSVEFLQEHFGQYDTATEMKAATTSEGLHLYFDWLVQQGKLPS